MKHFLTLLCALFSFAFALSSNRKDETLQKHLKMLKTVEQAKLSVRIKDILNSEDFQEAATNVIKVVAKHLALPSEENAPGDASALSTDKSAAVFPEQQESEILPSAASSKAQIQNKFSDSSKAPAPPTPKPLKPITDMPIVAQIVIPRKRCRKNKKQFDLDGFIGKEEKNYDFGDDENATPMSSNNNSLLQNNLPANSTQDFDSSLKQIMADFTRKVLEGVADATHSGSSFGRELRKPAKSSKGQGDFFFTNGLKAFRGRSQSLNESPQESETNVKWEMFGGEDLGAVGNGSGAQ